MSKVPRTRAVATQPVTEQAAPARRPLGRIPPPPALAPVSVNGTFVDGTKLVTRTAASLHLTTGRLSTGDDAETRKVLVAFAEMRLGGSPVGREQPDDEADDEDTETLYATSMPLENFAFVLLDLARDLNRMCGEVTALHAANLTVDPARMAAVRYFVAHLERQARTCRVKLDEAYGVPDLSATD